MLTREQATSDVMRLFTERLMIAVSDPHADLLGSGLLDSAGLVDLLLLLEERFGIRLNLEDLDMDDFHNCDSIAALVIASLPAGNDWKPELAPAVSTAV